MEDTITIKLAIKIIKLLSSIENFTNCLQSSEINNKIKLEILKRKSFFDCLTDYNKLFNEFLKNLYDHFEEIRITDGSLDSYFSQTIINSINLKYKYYKLLILLTSTNNIKSSNRNFNFQSLKNECSYNTTFENHDYKGNILILVIIIYIYINVFTRV
jgi:hypothetical protein